MPFPNVIIAGPPKTGTTSIFHWLSQHPEVCTSRVKETQYFHDRVTLVNKEANYHHHGIARYDSLFKCEGDSKVIFEATPDYIYSKTALVGLRELPELKKIIFIFRDPADRLLSEYRFHKYKTKSFSGSFGEYCGYNGETFNGTNVKRGKITDLINAWIEQFGSARISVYDFELLKTPQYFLKRLCSDLELNASFYEGFDFTIKNETVFLRSRSLHLFALKVKRLFPSGLAKVLLPFYNKLNQSATPSLSQNDLDVWERLKEYYSDQQNPEFLKS